MNGKRGQTATEYLIILAVVIVIALVVVVALGQFPGLTEDRTDEAYWQMQDIGISSYAFAADEGVLVLENNMGSAVTVENVTIDEDKTETDLDLSLTVGATGEVDLTGLDECEQGEAYSYPVEIEYADEATGATYTMDGGGETLDGVCAGSLS
ncbi:MAG: hypothetical protein ACOCZ6_04495 [Nanoarchaeota archaeon]